jgi:hypothetical protein
VVHDRLGIRDSWAADLVAHSAALDLGMTHGVVYLLW